MATTSTTPPAARRRVRRSRLGLATWVALLAVGLWVLHQLGAAGLEPPPADPDGWGVWLQGRDPLVATVAFLRLVALALGWYLLAATVLGVVARLPRAGGLVWAADRVTVPALRRLLRDALGALVVAASQNAEKNNAGTQVED
jgi:hypothetical protein